jgi:23S rRNA maturation mini-RNase III
MDSEPKKLQLNKKESGEEPWIDKLAKAILAYDGTEIREKQILKFLIDSLHAKIMKEENKRDVSKLQQALSELNEHYKEMKMIMLKAENYDEDCMINEKYEMNRRKNNAPSEDSSDNNDDEDDDKDDEDDREDMMMEDYVEDFVELGSKERAEIEDTDEDEDEFREICNTKNWCGGV